MYSVSRSSCYVRMHVVAMATVVEITKIKDLKTAKGSYKNKPTRHAIPYSTHCNHITKLQSPLNALLYVVLHDIDIFYASYIIFNISRYY